MKCNNWGHRSISTRVWGLKCTATVRTFTWTKNLLLCLTRLTELMHSLNWRLGKSLNHRGDWSFSSNWETTLVQCSWCVRVRCCFEGHRMICVMRTPCWRCPVSPIWMSISVEFSSKWSSRAEVLHIYCSISVSFFNKHISIIHFKEQEHRYIFRLRN